MATQQSNPIPVPSYRLAHPNPDLNNNVEFYDCMTMVISNLENLIAASHREGSDFRPVLLWLAEHEFKDIRAILDAWLEIREPRGAAKVFADADNNGAGARLLRPAASSDSDADQQRTSFDDMYIALEGAIGQADIMFELVSGAGNDLSGLRDGTVSAWTHTLLTQLSVVKAYADGFLDRNAAETMEGAK